MAKKDAAFDAPRTERLILELLTAAAAAHGVHEKEDLGGVYDEQWPQWYAAHIAASLAERGLVVSPRRPTIAESFDLSGDVAGWDDWL
ncbi:hypothetical protein D7I44_05845 [Gryllotalpicola protaetiae]|uniref:Uncharacterized protein n=2 Tax=Gryllotalpicola protaetiae TaxID=2419771 RepID=A0A387BPZ6_9MICO|nr:hypothetical protein D7I44_05845 [Gryllotalpicola protaetiae]